MSQEVKEEYDFETTIATELEYIAEVIRDLSRSKRHAICKNNNIGFNVKGTITFDLRDEIAPEIEIKLNAV